MATLAPAAAVAINGGSLALGSGLLALVRPALLRLETGGVLAVLSENEGVAQDLSSWCRSEGHTYLGADDTIRPVQRHMISRGRFGGSMAPHSDGPASLQVTGEGLTSDQLLRAIPMPEAADRSSGFAPRGSFVEPGTPSYPFDLLDRDAVAPPEVGKLYDQAVAAQWSSSRDIAWKDVPRHASEIDAAVVQIMTFLAENELSALYLPSKFISRIHPAFAEVAMFLATQLHDEARHIDVFLKRAHLAGSHLGQSSVTTSRSLLSLLQLDDFTESAFLLSVLGEGTFLDLLSYIERHAPDDPTAELVRRARTDEARHVHFGLAHVRHALAHNPHVAKQLEAAVRRRSATLHGASGVPAAVQDSLTMLAAGSTEPRAVARGHEAFRELLDTMHTNRMKRLAQAGFDAETSQTLSDLHTPNFM